MNKFFLLSWSADRDRSVAVSGYSNRKSDFVPCVYKRDISGTVAKLKEVVLLPNDKAHPELRIAEEKEEIRFDISEGEYDLLKRDSYNGEYLVEVDGDGNVISIYDSHRPPQIMEEGPKGHRIIKTNPKGYHEGAIGVSAGYTKRGDFTGSYERSEDFNDLYEFVEELVNS